MTWSKLVGALVGASVLMGSADAEELKGTLKRIKDTGTLNLGVRESSIPFSYSDGKQSYQGYSIDLCQKVAAAVQKKLGLTSLNIKMVPVTSVTRIPLVANETIDIACDSATNNNERQKQVAFSMTGFITSGKFLAKKSANLKTLNDLRNKTIVSTAGTSSLKLITVVNGERNLGMRIFSGRDHAESFAMFESGRADAFVLDEVLLSALAAHSKTPGDYQLSTEALSIEPYGLMFRRDDPGFKRVVDDALSAVFKSEEIKTLQTKWFQSPIPPRGVNLNLRMPPALQFVLSHPTDSGDPAAYGPVPEAQKTASRVK